MDVTGRPGPATDAGWLPDPTDRFPERYRMRTGWTPRVRVGTAEAVDEVVPGDTPREDRVPAAASPDPPPVDAGEDGSGWRPDPTDRFDERWWDGVRFTRRVRHGGSVATDTISPPQPNRPRERAGSGAGWRPDPDGAGERYHDGHAWTAKRRPAGGGRAEGRPGSLRAWLPRSVAAALVVLLALVVAIVLVVVVMVV